jgi:hypothetical protein
MIDSKINDDGRKEYFVTDYGVWVLDYVQNGMLAYNPGYTSDLQRNPPDEKALFSINPSGKDFLVINQKNQIDQANIPSAAEMM